MTSLPTPSNRIIGLTAKGCTAVDGRHTLGCVACGARMLTELPEGFAKVSVLVRLSELDQLPSRALTPGGTYSEAIREALGMSHVPYGLKAAIARMTNNEE